LTGIATCAVGLEIALYSQNPYVDTVRESIKMLLPVKKPYDMFTDHLTDLLGEEVREMVNDKPCEIKK
jgi:hypothetical protein